MCFLHSPPHGKPARPTLQPQPVSSALLCPCLAPQNSLPIPPSDSWQPWCPSRPCCSSPPSHRSRCLRRITTLFIPTQPFHRVQTQDKTPTQPPHTHQPPKAAPHSFTSTPMLPCARRPQPCSDPQPLHTTQTWQRISALRPLTLVPAHQKAPLSNYWHQLVITTAQCQDFQAPMDEFGSLNQTSAPPLLWRVRG